MRDDEFEWHDAKAKLNARDHRVKFEFARYAFQDPRFIEQLDPDETNEELMLLTGLVGEVLLTVCYVERGERKRIISARKATKREQDDYNSANTQA